MSLEPVTLVGVVLAAFAVGDYDKRLILLTKERGKITVFARGARKPNSSLMAACNPFVFGSFSIYEGRNSYSLMQVNVVHYFTELAMQQPQVYYGFYFLDFAEYYGQENNGELQTVNLIYMALKALQNEKIDNDLVRYIYEIRIMAINGEFGIEANEELKDSTLYTLQYIISSPVQKLFSFTVSNEVKSELKHLSNKYRQLHVERKLKSLDILEMMISM